MDADVLVVGGGPAGAIAALMLARAGVRVRILDRSTFPRDKLCGDSLNPGAMALLARHGLAECVEARGLAVTGMLVTGPGGVRVIGTYPDAVVGRSLTRDELDVLLLAAAERAGAAVNLGVRVHGPLVEGAGAARRITGLTVARRQGCAGEHRARLVIAADGRRSAIACALGLTSHPRRPRRWALGAYYEGVSGVSTVGEMHVRRGSYVGIAAVPGDRTNVCLVVPETRARQIMRAPAVALEAAVTCDDALRDRFRSARRVGDVRVLGPLAVNVSAAGLPGLLLAGDAAGFIDPMTGDGMRIAMRGAELAAAAGLRALQGPVDVHHELARARAREFAVKLRVNRLLRSLVAQPPAVMAAALVSAAMPWFVERAIAYSGDVTLTTSGPLVSAGAAI